MDRKYGSGGYGDRFSMFPKRLDMQLYRLPDQLFRFFQGLATGYAPR